MVPNDLQKLLNKNALYSAEIILGDLGDRFPECELIEEASEYLSIGEYFKGAKWLYSEKG